MRSKLFRQYFLPILVFLPFRFVRNLAISSSDSRELFPHFFELTRAATVGDNTIAWKQGCDFIIMISLLYCLHLSNMVTAGWLQRISHWTEGNQKRQNILNE